VDNLRTNHRVSIVFISLASIPDTFMTPQGVYVLQDNSFKPISRLSSWDGRADALHRAKLVRPMLSIWIDVMCPIRYRCSTSQCQLESSEAR